MPFLPHLKLSLLTECDIRTVFHWRYLPSSAKVRPQPSTRASEQSLITVCEAAAAVDCSANITIADSDDASEVRKACTTIEGSLVFKRRLSDNINLDGVETVLGHVTHYGCSLYEDDDCAKVSSLFNISSSTLTTINGSLYFENFSGLNKLSFPNLSLVNGSFDLDRNKNLTHLDITHLTHVGSFHLDGAVALKRLDHDRLEGLTERRGSVVVMDSGNIDSLDSFTEYPITSPQGEQELYLGFIMNRMDNIKNLTFGWANTSMVNIDGENLTITLGGPSTKAMYMEDFSTNADLIRSPDLENLTAMTVTIGDSSWLTKSPLLKVSVWFDNLWSVMVSGSNITTVEIPSEAENWSSPRVWVNTQMTDIREYDDDGTKIWHWPKILDSLTLEGSMNNSFL